MGPQLLLEQQLVLLAPLWATRWVVRVVRRKQRHLQSVSLHPQQPFRVAGAVVLRQSLRRPLALEPALVEQDKSVEAVEPLLLAQRPQLEISLVAVGALAYLVAVQGQPQAPQPLLVNRLVAVEVEDTLVQEMLLPHLLLVLEQLLALEVLVDLVGVAVEALPLVDRVASAVSVLY
jgi:hypothetical protein